MKKECVLSLQMERFLGLMNGDIMAEKIVVDEDFTEKTSDWDESDIGKRIVKRVTSNGTYFNEMIVHVLSLIHI